MTLFYALSLQEGLQVSVAASLLLAVPLLGHGHLVAVGMVVLWRTGLSAAGVVQGVEV